VRDGIAVARRGRPAVAIVTAKFRVQGDFIARAEGMPDVPRVEVPHPVAGIGRDAMMVIAARVCGDIVTRLRQG
jgi:hypothetical protein